MNRLTLLLFTSILILLGSCKKRCPTVYFDQDTKDYGVFNTGTWWIFQNDSTLITDTIVVSSTSHGFHNYCGQDMGGSNEYTKPEYFRAVVLFHSHYGSMIVDPDGIVACADTCTKFSLWNELIPSGNVIPITARFDSMIVNGKTYYDVLQVNINAQFEHYYARHVFAIKAINKATGESLSLVDSHILQ